MSLTHRIENGCLLGSNIVWFGGILLTFLGK